ncbi:Beta-galactosidase [Mycena kentingensis (nom. inval.)]|nr:Beta-galactosidase [Mycena kentingensis (nom. inval.)]
MLPAALVLLLAALGAVQAALNGTLARRKSTGLSEAVTWDEHSLFIQGQRVFILSAEVHPWRLPGNPDLWTDIFQKIKANGFNAVSFYVNWAVHYPTPNTNGAQGDFQPGTYRDIERFIQEAKKAGLWLIARPGPYINGETTGGGFPGWVGNVAGSLRTNNPNFTQAWTPYMTSMSRLIAKYQITEGGPIILVQAENEFSQGTTQSPYMQAIIDTYRANGIVIRRSVRMRDRRGKFCSFPYGPDVELISNFSPDKTTLGAVDIYCGDSYPQGANSWAQVQAIYRSAHEAVFPSGPLCLAEFGGGFLLQWGAAPFGGTGYEKYSVSPGLTNADYENVFYKENYAQTATILNVYMLWGGTNWGGTAAPVSYTSYDYGGGINENRVANAKMNEMRLQGLFPTRLARPPRRNLHRKRDKLHDVADHVRGGAAQPRHRRGVLYDAAQCVDVDGAYDDADNSEYVVGAIDDPEDGGVDVQWTREQGGIIVTDYVFGASATTIVYSTAEIMTWTTVDNTDYLILYAPTGQTGETALRFASAPTVTTSNSLDGFTSSFANGIHTLNYALNGSTFVTITQGRTKIIALLLDKPTANQWHAPIIPAVGNFGNFFLAGDQPNVCCFASTGSAISGTTLTLTGDTNGTTPIEIIAPSSVSRVTWNNVTVRTTRSSRGTLTGSLNGAVAITLPTLSNWKVSGSLPEIDPVFDDSSFTKATLTTTNYTNLPPLAGDVVLYSQQYGFYGNNLIFRGRFTAAGGETGINITVQYGFGGGYSAWLNGVFLGSSQGNSTVSLSTDVWTFPADHTGISETSTNGGKEPRGIRGYALLGAATKFTSWTLQGNQGGAANAPDTYRGYLNEGGLYAERIGAHLPGFPDSSWISGSPLSGVSKAGINFYRTTFNFPVPAGVDAPIRLSVTRNATAAAPNFRMQFYLNGWQIGKYANSIGPQTIFVLPAGILNRKSSNTLGVMVWAMDAAGAVIQDLEIISDGFYSTSLTFNDYISPNYADQKALRPTPEFFAPM